MRAISWSVRVWLPLVLAAGCATTSRAGLADIGPREVQNLERVASQDLACPVGELYTRPVTDRIWEVSGCNDRAEYTIVQRNFRARRWTPVVPIGVRASNELGCPQEGLVVEAAGPEQRRVSGCGRSARYQLMCGSGGACDWSLIEQGGAYRSSGVTVTPPRDQRPQPPPVVVVPDQRVGGDAAERFVRDELDRQRSAILSCAPGAPAVVLRAHWGPDGMVRVNIHPSTASFRAIQPCVLGSIPQLQVTDGQSGDIIHVIR